MAPKKPKDTTLDENYWRICIEEAPLNEESWEVKVIMIEAAGNDQDRIYLNKFETFAAEERRFVIKNICKTETIFMVNQLGGEKKVKDDNLRVFEEGQMYLKDKKDVPPDILALIIKYLILKMKDEYLFIKRQKLEVREGMRRESSTMVSRAEVRGTVNANLPEQEKVQELPKGKKEAGEPLLQTTEDMEGKKYNTMLRVRGEEWRDKIYVDDFPMDGPNLYVAVTGFTEPYLAGSLIKIGVPLTAIVQIRINPTNVKVPSGLFRTTKRGQSQTEILTAKSQKFWEDLQELRIHVNTCDDYKNTAFIVFSPPYWEADNLSGDSEKIYDELCFLMYDIQDLTRQHSNYLDNMEVINIPIETGNDYSEKYYYQHIAELPLECVTIYSVLDSILYAVCNSLEVGENSTVTSLSTAITLNHAHLSSKDESKLQKAETLVTDVFKILCNPDSNKKMYRITYGEEYESHKDPTVINYGDFAKHKVFHLGNINMENIVKSMLHGIPIFTLWKSQGRQSRELEAKINFHVNVLLSCFERKDIETVELNRLIHILACRKMYNNRSSLKVQHLPPSSLTEFKKVFLKRTVLAEPLPMSSASYRSWSVISPPFASLSQKDIKSPNIDRNSESCRIKYLFDCPDISELVSAAEIACNMPVNHIIDDFDFFEEFSNSSAFQTMVNAFNLFNCVDYKYCEVTDSIILMFFNSHNDDGISREEWRCHLPTPLCLQDFFDFVLEEHYDWIQKEEEIYEDNTFHRSQSVKNIFDVFAERNCINNTEVNVDLLMEGSIKHQELGEEEAVPENTVIKSKSTSMSPSTTDMTSKSSKKTKSSVSTPKSVKQPLYVDDSNSSEKAPLKPFSGYNLSDRRVEIFGKDSCFFSKDGTNVLTKYTIMIPGNSEYVVLKVAPGNGNTEFWMHKALGDAESEILDMCESFRISSKDNVMIYIKKQSYVVPSLTLHLSCSERPTDKNKIVKSSPHIYSSSKVQVMENKSFHSLNVTWPNGLITETVHENNSARISHIKQFYVAPVTNVEEDMRCISLKGDVIIFKSLELIEVLRPDGSCINITKCEKKINQETCEDLQSDTSSDKSKKGKGKEKNKPSKASSKTSKNVIDIDEKISEIKVPEYELFIDEFETIEANGLMQKWLNDMPIDAKKLLIRTATDFCSGEVFSRRMDGTSILLNKDGIQIITFPDGTRIITTFIIDEHEVYPEWTEEEIEYFAMFDSDTVDTDTVKSKSTLSQSSENMGRSSTSEHSKMFKKIEEEIDNENIQKKERIDGYISVHIIFTIEHRNFATITLNTADGMISVISPNNVKVVVSPDNNFNFTLDNVTTAEFNGQDLNINYTACPQCESYTTCKVKIKYDEIPSATNFQKRWVKMEDSFNKMISVNNEGNINIIEESFSDEVAYEESFNNDIKIDHKCRKVRSENSLGKCRELYEAKALRFFILRRELTCSELVHRALIDQYKKRCRWQPWCSINQYDTFGDNRSILSILTPIHLTETEKWLMDSQFADKPKYLTYKHLKEDSGKGFYHWMRPYGRFQPKYLKPENVVPDRLPRAFVLRNLEQQWSDANRENLKGGKELLTAILRYRNLMESNSDTILYVPIRDPRPDDERTVDAIIQAIAKTTYEDLKHRLAEDVQKRAKPTITTKPLIQSEDSSMEGELEELPDELTTLEDRRSSLVKEVEVAEEMSPNLKRYWRRRAEEYKEELFYKYLLREGSVPPYFRNVLGGAIWWELNNLTDEATVKAERRKMKCVCEDQGETSSLGDITGPPVT